MPTPISIQLYSLRQELLGGMQPVLEKLASIGFSGVESAGFGDLDATSFKRTVESLGMTVSSAHTGLPALNKADGILDELAPLGEVSLVVAFLPPEGFASVSELQRTAEQLNVFNEKARQRGFSLGYHNHWFEFQSNVGGMPAYLRLFEEVDETIFAELDTYWARVGGADPADVIRHLGHRAKLLHIKDGPADKPESDMVAVGEGVMDVHSIVAVSEADWHVVELDRCASDMFLAIEKSHQFLVSIGENSEEV